MTIIILCLTFLLLSACGGGSSGGGNSSNSVNIFPSESTVLHSTSELSITFNKEMDPATLVINTSTGVGHYWSDIDVITNSVLGISPVSKWPDGNLSMTIDVKDVDGNSLPTISLNFNVDAVSPTYTITPPVGSTIKPDTAIEIRFSESMWSHPDYDIGLMSTESDGGIWKSVSQNNDTLIISPTSTWSLGSLSEGLLSFRDIAGNSISISLNYMVSTSACTPGTTAACGTNTGQCTTGTITCQVDGTWSACTGVAASTEVCDNKDNDCDGQTDEGLSKTVTNGTQQCISGIETVSCSNTLYANCDNNNTNGCEASLVSNSNCGSCGNVCGTGTTCNIDTLKCEAGTINLN